MHQMATPRIWSTGHGPAMPWRDLMHEHEDTFVGNSTATRVLHIRSQAQEALRKGIMMPKRLQKSGGPPYSPNGADWNIRTGRLSEAGRADILMLIGRQLQTVYQETLDEPEPDRIRELLKRLEARGRSMDDGSFEP